MIVSASLGRYAAMTAVARGAGSSGSAGSAGGSSAAEALGPDRARGHDQGEPTSTQ